jgi:hypothetical protein
MPWQAEVVLTHPLTETLTCSGRVAVCDNCCMLMVAHMEMGQVRYDSGLISENASNTYDRAQASPLCSSILFGAVS